jgi:hypothetical protein
MQLPATGWQHQGHPGFGGWVWMGPGQPTGPPPPGIDSPTRPEDYHPPDPPEPAVSVPPDQPAPPVDHAPSGPPLGPPDHHDGGSGGTDDPTGALFGSGADDPLAGIDQTITNTLGAVLDDPSPPMDHDAGGDDLGMPGDDGFGTGSVAPAIDDLVSSTMPTNFPTSPSHVPMPDPEPGDVAPVDVAPADPPPDPPVPAPDDPYISSGPEDGPQYAPPGEC